MSINSYLKRTVGDPYLRALSCRILEEQRLTEDEGIYLLKKADTGVLGLLVREVSAQRNIPYVKKRAYHLSLSSEFLRTNDGKKISFSRLKRHLSSVSQPDILMLSSAAATLQVSPECLCKAVSVSKDLYSGTWITGFDGLSLDAFCRGHKISMDDILSSLKDSGLSHISLGSVASYGSLHKKAHEVGLSSSIPFTYSPGGSSSDCLSLLGTIRNLQDQSHGIERVVPVWLSGQNNGCTCPAKSSIIDTLRIFAVSRIFLDNIRDIDSQSIIGPPGWEKVFSFGSNRITFFQKGSAPYIPDYGKVFVSPVNASRSLGSEGPHLSG